MPLVALGQGQSIGRNPTAVLTLAAPKDDRRTNPGPSVMRHAGRDCDHSVHAAAVACVSEAAVKSQLPSLHVSRVWRVQLASHRPIGIDESSPVGCAKNLWFSWAFALRRTWMRQSSQVLLRSLSVGLYFQLIGIFFEGFVGMRQRLRLQSLNRLKEADLFQKTGLAPWERRGRREKKGWGGGGQDGRRSL